LRYDAKLVNNDGIDPESSSNILIENIVFNNGDDNIAIKSGRDHDGRSIAKPAENIVIRNCQFKGLHGVVLGSEMSGGIRNVFIHDCASGGYCKRAFYAKTNPDRGGFINNIQIHDCRFDEVEDLLYITSRFAGEGENNSFFPQIEGIHVSNVHCRKASGAAVVLQGTEKYPLRDIYLEEIVVDSAKVGISMQNTDVVSLKNCHLGGIVTGIPTQISTKDNIFR
ncbi:MAG: right-handed parallel beta-helix repeat-containing protein, partial [Fibrobacter sp.]|nr:right-handed parallel beta-helix repeat-containing protein [Fibrobacter sp.]